MFFEAPVALIDIAMVTLLAVVYFPSCMLYIYIYKHIYICIYLCARTYETSTSP